MILAPAPARVKDAFQKLDPLWAELFPAAEERIVKAVLHGNEPDGISLSKLHKDLPVCWREQREKWRGDSRTRPAVGA